MREINVLRKMKNRCFRDWHSNRFVANQELERKDMKERNVKRANPSGPAHRWGLTWLVEREAKAQILEKEEWL